MITAPSMERARVPVGDGVVALVLHVPGGTVPVPLVVACHGLAASKDSDKYLLMADELPRAGLALVRFDFRGCGESSGVEDETTVGTRIADAEAVIERLRSHPALDGRVGLLGSSLGGFVALHVAARRTDAPPVVTWNAPADLATLPDDGPRPGLGAPFFAEVASGRHVSAPAVAKHLVVQAELDDVVPPAHGGILRRRALPPSELVVIPGADHRLTEIAHRRVALARSLDWFVRFLAR